MSIDGITPDAPSAAPAPATPPTPGQAPPVRFAARPERPQGPSTFLIVKTEACVWCQKTLEFLRALHEERGDFQVAVLDAGDQRDAFQQIAAHTRRTTVPQIFLDGGFVGGWNELAVAAKKGQLDAYLDGQPWEPEAPRPWWRRLRRGDEGPK